MILHPRFYIRPELDIAATRRGLGLLSDRPTLLVMFGGQGSFVMLRIAERLNNCTAPIQAIFVCGRNERLRSQLLKKNLRFPAHIEGFTTEVPGLMAVSDFFVGKPGPGSISEALLHGLPLIVTRNAATMPQERYNTEWILANQVGVVLRDFGGLDREVDRLLAGPMLARMRMNAAATNNRAVFEIVEILHGILARNGHTKLCAVKPARRTAALTAVPVPA